MAARNLEPLYNKVRTHFISKYSWM